MYVYVIGVPGVLTAKIGVTSDLQRRLREIQNMSPVKLEVLWSCPGSNALEQAIHAHFAEARSHGEWFVFERDPVSTVRNAVESGLVVVVEKTSPTVESIEQPPPLDLSRTAHRAIWKSYADTRFTTVDAASRLGYTLVTLLGHLDELVDRGLARQRLPVRSDRAHQLFTVRRPV
ncbi:GIY-YIG nuclease family protein (plasmid) [Streptomyces sp. NBC_01717]|uniref:GIY-YIG nuclease family protein n=1 Tax=Streptomyces sp. NBC_01717 TaxID=2975918 RepID=UPI002E37545A|nr:GIY-YIG nuclease family protein [Streptomyces sp. NBC_01717]